MKQIEARNVHDALTAGVEYLTSSGVRETQRRNGVVITAPEEVVTVYARPEERVLLHEWRDANPFFHLYECVWMMAGRRDVAPLARFVGRMTQFSDDGVVQNAAYGHRWRVAYGDDQLAELVRRLSASRGERRAVLQIWDARSDLWNRAEIATGRLVPYVGADAACNVAVVFSVVGDAMRAVVFCRSNDMIWGAYGSNAVHFSFLQEYVARSVGVPCGPLTQISVNWHAYEEVWVPMLERRSRTPETLSENPYENLVRPHPILSTDREIWDEECRVAITSDGSAPRGAPLRERFFSDVFVPVVRAHDAWRDGRGGRRARAAEALSILSDCAASDWRVACSEWLQRRM